MKVRKAIFEDAPILLDLINKKADFDRSMRGFEGEITTSVERIQKTFFNPEPFAHAIILELSGEPIGFAIFHYRYSSFSGLPSVWLDDLLVLNTERSKGHGRKVMTFLKELAQEKGVSHISWTASPINNRAHQFYLNLGAKVERMDGDRPFFRWDI